MRPLFKVLWGIWFVAIAVVLIVIFTGCAFRYSTDGKNVTYDVSLNPTEADYKSFRNLQYP